MVPVCICLVCTALIFGSVVYGYVKFHTFFEDINEAVSRRKVARNFVEASIEIQIKLARNISEMAETDVYLFDSNGKFDNAVKMTYNCTNYLRIGNDLAVLSGSAQAAFPDANTYMQFVKPERINELLPRADGVLLVHRFSNISNSN